MSVQFPAERCAPFIFTNGKNETQSGDVPESASSIITMHFGLTQHALISTSCRTLTLPCNVYSRRVVSCILNRFSENCSKFLLCYHSHYAALPYIIIVHIASTGIFPLYARCCHHTRLSTLFHVTHTHRIGPMHNTSALHKCLLWN